MASAAPAGADTAPPVEAPAGRRLFMRLMAVQVLTMLGLVAVLMALFYVERNATVARLAATAWTPALLQALDRGGAPLVALQQRDTRPAGALTLPAGGPRTAALRETLGRGGIRIGEVALDPGPAQAVLWLQVPVSYTHLTLPTN